MAVVDAQTETVHGLSLGRCLQWSAALLSDAAAAIHFGAMGEHAGVSWSHGLFFAGAAWCELVFAAWILWRPTSRAAWFGIALNAGVLAVWVVSRTVGIPIGSDGEPETVGFIDTLASFIEIATIVACVGLLSPSVATARIGRVVGIGGVAVVGAVTIVPAPAAFTPCFAAREGHDHGAPAAGDPGDTHAPGAAAVAPWS
ncbi:MAG: hypothetical protein ACKORK_04000, partial [Gemmatimonadota bacterium]